MIKVTNDKEFDKFKKIFERLNMLGCLHKDTIFQNWQEFALINNKRRDLFLFEYQNYKGLTWTDNEEKSIKWYEREPLTIQEVYEELFN